MRCPALTRLLLVGAQMPSPGPLAPLVWQAGDLNLRPTASRGICSPGRTELSNCAWIRAQKKQIQHAGKDSGNTKLGSPPWLGIGSRSCCTCRPARATDVRPPTFAQQASLLATVRHVISFAAHSEYPFQISVWIHHTGRRTVSPFFRKRPTILLSLESMNTFKSI